MARWSIWNLHVCSHRIVFEPEVHHVIKLSLQVLRILRSQISIQLCNFVLLRLLVLYVIDQVFNLIDVQEGRVRLDLFQCIICLFKRGHHIKILLRRFNPLDHFIHHNLLTHNLVLLFLKVLFLSQTNDCSLLLPGSC